MFDILQEVYGAISRNRIRSAATGFAVASGIFLMIVLQGAGNGIVHTLDENMSWMTFDLVRVFGGRTTLPFEGMREGRLIKLDERDLAMTKRTFSEQVSNAIPTLNVDGRTVSVSDKHLSGIKMVGVFPDHAATMAIHMLEGRFVNKTDVDDKRKVVVIDSNSARDLFAHGRQPIGASLSVSGICYRVVGIYKASEMNSKSEMYAPYTTIATIYNRGRFIDEMTMTIKNIPTDEDMNKFEKDYVRATSYIHSYSPDDERALWIWNQANGNIALTKAKTILRTALWVLGLLTLISGIVGVSNIMLISVAERTREFGIRRAIGARPTNILSMVITESIIVTGIFGYVGMLLGVFFCEWMDAAVGGQTMDVGVFKAEYFIDPTVGLDVCVTATVIIVTAGALAGLFPAMKAVRMKPIDALRA